MLCLRKLGRTFFFIVLWPSIQMPKATIILCFKMRSVSFCPYKTGEYPARFRSSILDLGKFFRKNGALFIPAHLHQSKSPENSRSIDDLYDDDTFLGFIADGAFDALEVRTGKHCCFFHGAVQD